MPAKRQPHPDREYHEALMAQIGTLAMTIGIAAAKRGKYASALVLAEGLVALLRRRQAESAGAECRATAGPAR